MRALKILHLGDSGAGKTVGLVSLLEAGYNVRVLDTDNNISGLLNVAKSPKYKNSPASRLSYITITEPMKMIQGRIVPKNAVMWPKAMMMMDKWENTDPEQGTVCSLGRVDSWTDKDVLVLDTLSALGQGAMNFGLQLNGALGAIRTQNEGRRDIGAAQALIRNLIQYLNDRSIKCHIIVNTHITFVRADGSGSLQIGDNQNSDVPVTGLPNAIGKAISPEIPRSFNTILFTDTVGSGAALRRKTYTVTRGNIKLKNVAPSHVLPEYDQEVALAEYFKAVEKAEKEGALT